MKQVKVKTIMICACVTVLLLCAATTAFSDGWFTSKVELMLTSNRSAGSQLLPIGSVGRDSTLKLGKFERIALPYEQEAEILSYADEGFFEEAEDMFIWLARNIDFSAPADDEELEYSSLGYYAYRLPFEFTYVNDSENALDAFVRFKPSSNYANMVVPGAFCLQTLAYVDERGRLVELPRLHIKDQGLAYYYPEQLIPGDTIDLEYIIYINVSNFRNFIDSPDILDFELIQVDNNASIVTWNVKIEKGDVFAYDKALLKDISYYKFKLDIEWLEEEEVLEEELEEEDLEELEGGDADLEGELDEDTEIDPDLEEDVLFLRDEQTDEQTDENVGGGNIEEVKTGETIVVEEIGEGVKEGEGGNLSAGNPGSGDADGGNDGADGDDDRDATMDSGSANAGGGANAGNNPDGNENAGSGNPGGGAANLGGGYKILNDEKNWGLSELSLSPPPEEALTETLADAPAEPEAT